MARQFEDVTIGFRLSKTLKGLAEERANACGLSLSDYLKGLMAADLRGEQAFYSQRAAMNSHMTLMIAASLLKREGGDQTLQELWGPMEEMVTATYGPYQPMPQEIMAKLRTSKKPLFQSLFNLFRSHAMEEKIGK